MNDPAAIARLRIRESAQTTLAGFSLGVAFLCFSAFVVHLAQIATFSDEASIGNDLLESALGMAWLVSALLSMVMSCSLDSRIRQFIFVSGALLSGFAVLFWFVFAPH